MAKSYVRVGNPPKNLRITLILSDVDQDLKEWCWANPGSTTSLLRSLLREELQASGEVSIAPQPTRQSKVASAQTARMARARQEAGAPKRAAATESAVGETANLPDAVIPSVEMLAPNVAPVAPASPPVPPPSQEPAVVDTHANPSRDERALKERLRSILSANGSFS